MSTQIGMRVMAIRNSDEDCVYSFGCGSYQGDEIPPEDVCGPFGRLGLFGVRSPKLLMDDGTVVWGCESWWIDESRAAETVGNRRVEIVRPERTPATNKERKEGRKSWPKRRG